MRLEYSEDGIFEDRGVGEKISVTVEGENLERKEESLAIVDEQLSEAIVSYDIDKHTIIVQLAVLLEILTARM